MTLCQAALGGIPPTCPPDGSTTLACPCHPCPSNRTTAKSSRNPRHAGWPSELSQSPVPRPTFELNFIWASAFFSVPQRQVNNFSSLSVAPDTTSSSIRFDTSKKLAMTFRLAIIVYRISELLLLSNWFSSDCQKFLIIGISLYQ